MEIFLPVTLGLAAAAALINMWLSIRIGRLRTRAKVSVGDGGNDALARRMRAQLNFAENTPIVLVLVAVVELAGLGGWWLAPVAALYAIGRILHGIGMDGGALEKGRMIGTLLTMLTQLFLAGLCVGALVAYAT